ncbi:MAG: hypothetical protein AAF720_06345 [Pseudomonadota bacterium]
MSSPTDRLAYLNNNFTQPCSEAAKLLATDLQKKYEGSSVLLYGSAGSVLSDADATDVLFDFYVIVPSYRVAYRSSLLRLANILIPPNVFYHSMETPKGLLRTKYAVLSLPHFEKLVSQQTFHSYFWARFAQPFKIVVFSESDLNRLVAAAATAIDTFTRRAAPLSVEKSDENSIDEKSLNRRLIDRIWQAGLSRSYKAELRAEQPGRAAQLLNSYGDWPQKVTNSDVIRNAVWDGNVTKRADYAWRLRAFQGGILSVLRLLKAAGTFQGGAEYITWKIQRHSGIDVPVREWERKFPFFAAPFFAMRYYRLKANKAKTSVY